MPTLTPHQLAAARAWIDDCHWHDLHPDDPLTPQEIEAGIANHYQGGIHAFLLDWSSSEDEQKAGRP